MKPLLKTIGFRIFLIMAWILLAVLFYLFPPKSSQYVIALLVVAIIQGFIVAPWRYFKPGWEMLFYNLIPVTAVTANGTSLCEIGSRSWLTSRS